MKNFKNYRLGLDLGTNSIGFALLEINHENIPQKIIDAGVRIFSDSRDAKSKEPLAVARRIARGMRKRRDRALSRKKTLLNFLIANNLMPSNQVECQKIELLEPYSLRAKAIAEVILPSIKFLINKKEIICNQNSLKTIAKLLANIYFNIA
jgi:CRISPR-associated endonuclease Csn1